jgi:hypothetical protein
VPVVGKKVLRHDLDDRDVVALGAAAAAPPQAFAQRPDEAGRAAELVGQLLQKCVEPILRDLFTRRVSFGRSI